MVREEVVDAAGVHVERFAEILHRHRRALDVPAWPTAAPRRIPDDIAVVRSVALPEGEVAYAFLLVFVLAHAGAAAHAPDVDVRGVAVVGEVGDVEVDAAVF